MEFVGYKPYNHQLEVHSAISAHIAKNKRYTKLFRKTFCVLSRRQAGKTMLALNELLRFSITFKNSENFYIAPTFSLSKNIYTSLKELFEPSGLLKKTDAKYLIIELKNGSTIQCFSAEQGDKIRGYTCSGILVIDEAYFINDNFLNNVAFPFTITKKGIMLLISTPRFKNGLYYNLYMSGLSKENHDYVQSFSFMNHDLSFMIDEDELEQIRLNVPTNTFRCEYLGQFIDADSMVFGDFKKSIINAIPEYKKISVGIDWAAGGDDETVMTGLNENGHQVFIKRWQKIEPITLIDKIIEYLLQYEIGVIRAVTVEKNSIGAIYSSMIRRRLYDLKISMYKEFVTTNKSKREAIEKLQIAFQTGLIKILNDNEQIRQLELFEMNVNTVTKNISYGAPAGVGMHDDIVMALIFAYLAHNNKGLVFSTN